MQSDHSANAPDGPNASLQEIPSEVASPVGAPEFQPVPPIADKKKKPLKRKHSDDENQDPSAQSSDANDQLADAQDGESRQNASGEPLQLAQVEAETLGDASASGATVNQSAAVGTEVTPAAGAGSGGGFASSLSGLQMVSLALSSVGLGAAAGGGGSSVSSVISAIIGGKLQMGAFEAGTVTVQLYQQDGKTKLGLPGIVDKDGNFSIDIGAYHGVIIAKVLNTDTRGDYVDEATGQLTDLNLALVAVGVTSGAGISLNINPLTTMAARKMMAADGSVASAQDVTDWNAATAKVFGLTGDVTTNANVSPTLTAFSGLDSKYDGHQETTVSTLVSEISGDKTSAVLGENGKLLLIEGARIAEVNNPLNVGTLKRVSDALSTQSQVTIDPIAGDSVIQLDEVTAGISLTGTVAAGYTAVNLSFSGTAATGIAVVTGTTWTYTVLPADITALGADGAKAIVATATQSGSTPVAATRYAILNLVDNAPTDILLNEVITSTDASGNQVTTNQPIGPTAENTATTSHLKVGTIRFIDDGLGTNAATLTGADASYFEVVGNELFFKSGDVLNFESKSSYTITLNVGSKTKTFIINLSDVNEAPTAPATVTVPQAVINQTWAGIDTGFTDVDAGANGTLKYALDDASLAAGFSINASGHISHNNFDAVSTTPYSLTATATDGGGLTATKTLDVSVLAPPVVQRISVTDRVGNTNLGQSGDALNFVVTLSEAVTSTGPMTAHFSVNGQDVTATATAVTGVNTLTFTGSVPATGNGTAISLTSLVADNSGAITGNVTHQLLVPPTADSITYTGYTVDNTAPTLSSTAPSYTLGAALTGATGGDTQGETITLTITFDDTVSGLTSGTDSSIFTVGGTGVRPLTVSSKVKRLK